MNDIIIHGLPKLTGHRGHLVSPSGREELFHIACNEASKEEVPRGSTKVEEVQVMDAAPLSGAEELLVLDGDSGADVGIT